MGLEAARTLALSHAAKIALGGDPGEDLRREKLRPRSTVGPALDDYELALARRHIVNRHMVMSCLRRGFASVMGSEIDSLGLRDIVGLVERVATIRHKRKDGTVWLTTGAAGEFRNLRMDS